MVQMYLIITADAITNTLQWHEYNHCEEDPHTIVLFLQKENNIFIHIIWYIYIIRPILWFVIDTCCYHHSNYVYCLLFILCHLLFYTQQNSPHVINAGRMSIKIFNDIEALNRSLRVTREVGEWIRVGDYNTKMYMKAIRRSLKYNTCANIKVYI